MWRKLFHRIKKWKRIQNLSKSVVLGVSTAGAMCKEAIETRISFVWKVSYDGCRSLSPGIPVQKPCLEYHLQCCYPWKNLKMLKIVLILYGDPEAGRDLMFVNKQFEFSFGLRCTLMVCIASEGLWVCKWEIVRNQSFGETTPDSRFVWDEFRASWLI